MWSVEGLVSVRQRWRLSGSVDRMRMDVASDDVSDGVVTCCCSFVVQFLLLLFP